MPPRTTQEAIGHEPLIGPRLAMLRPSRLSVSEQIRPITTAGSPQEPEANRIASHGEANRNCTSMQGAGCRDTCSQPWTAGEACLLIPFYRTFRRDSSRVDLRPRGLPHPTTVTMKVLLRSCVFSASRERKRKAVSKTLLEQLTVSKEVRASVFCLAGKSNQALPFVPELAETSLWEIVLRQGVRCDDFREEEPSKILHEARAGEMTAFEERPHSPYFGSCDATPLFVVLLDEFERWTRKR
jgi:hypothetical protein